MSKIIDLASSSKKGSTKTPDEFDVLKELIKTLQKMQEEQKEENSEIGAVFIVGLKKLPHSENPDEFVYEDFCLNSLKWFLPYSQQLGMAELLKEYIKYDNSDSTFEVD